jgi:hypoxanthine phosphoribosyltransferase
MEQNRGTLLVQGWREFSSQVEDLRLAILKSGRQYKYITGIPRGGLVLATTLSHQLNLEFKAFETVNLTVYQHSMSQTDTPSAFHPENTLIVDDICDTGNTLKIWEKMGFDIAVCYLRIPSQFKPKFFATTVETEWVNFAWESNLV